MRNMHGSFAKWLGYVHPRRWISDQKQTLLKNTFMLYVLKFSGYFFALITIPYQARVLGPEYVGKLGFAMSIMIFFQLIIDYGFILHATSEISKSGEDRSTISKIFTSATTVKIMLSAVSVIILCALCVIFPSLGKDFWLYMLFLGATIAGSLMPDFVYRGMEKMTAITIRTVLVRLFSTILIFPLLRQPSDYYIVPLLALLGNTGALVGVYMHLHRRLQIRFAKIDFSYTYQIFKESSQFFFSRIASAVYGAANTLILGATSSGATVGYYVASERLVETAKGVMTPISDSLYPHMIKHKDYKLVARVLKLALPVICAAGIATFMFAESICTLLFGSEFAEAAPVLRALIPVFIVILPTYLLGFPTLGAMGLTKHANNSIFVGLGIQLLSLGILLATDNLTMVALAISTSIAEISVLGYRCMIIYQNRKLLCRPETER